MKINTKKRYGLRTMVEIARESNGNGIFQKEVASRQNLPVKYLDRIISSLKVANLIANVHGKKSGYILTRPASQITILDIYHAFEPEICVVDCLTNYKCNRESSCSARLFWEGLNNVVMEYFKSTTLENLLSQQVELEKQNDIVIQP